MARARQTLNPDDPKFAGGAPSLVGNLHFWTGSVPHDVTAETLLRTLRDLSWTAGVQRCSARGPRSLAWLLVADVAPPRRELRLKVGYDIFFTIAMNPAEERARPAVEKKDKATSARSKLVSGPVSPVPDVTPLCVEPA